MSDAGRLRAAGTLGCIAAISLVLGACSASVSVGTKTIAQDELQTEVQSQLSKTVGKQAPPITCPGDLDAKVDASTTCTLTDSGSTYDVAVKVTSVDGGTAKFDIQVADQPNP